MKFERMAFVKAEVILDDNEYINCSFQSCEFVFSGTGKVTLEYPSISDDCSFTFRGAASNTVVFMKAIYGIGNWGKSHVIATFQQIAPDLKNLH